MIYNFNTLSCEIILQFNHRIYIEPGDVIRVFDMPNGEKEIKRKTKPEHVELTYEWRAKSVWLSLKAYGLEAFYGVDDNTFDRVWYYKICPTTYNEMFRRCHNDARTNGIGAHASLNQIVESKRKWEKERVIHFVGRYCF